jgi:hypothetical protein
MGGGLMQLIATGVMDTYLTGNPQITYFKSVYRRYTNFSMESRKLNFNGTTNFNGTNICTISKGPDLLYKVYLQTKLPEIKETLADKNYLAFRWLNWVGHRLIKNSKIIIGGVEIDKNPGEWLHLWNELSQKNGQQEAYAEMVGNVPGLTQISSIKGDGTTEQTVCKEYNLFIPLQFWFCKNPGMAIPLVALKYSNVEIEIEFEKLDKLIWASLQNTTQIKSKIGDSALSTKPSLEAHIYADYIYLDIDERKRFSNNQHEYLIELVQEKGTTNFEGSSTSTSNINKTFTLTFTHPVKELIWIIQPTEFTSKKYCQSKGGCQPFNFTDQFDYSGFSGTPEPSFGPGMVGGRRNNNLWYGLPSVKLPYVKDIIEPDFSKSDSDSPHPFYTEIDAVSTLTSAGAVEKTNLKQSGYDYISKYYTGGNDLSTEKTIENCIGNNSSIFYDSAGESGSSNNTTNGIWSNSNLNLKLIDTGVNPTVNASIWMNGVRRFDEREGTYFNTIQPYQHHTNSPAVGINVYSFSIEPENHQPSGTCNFSKIDDAQINITVTEQASKRNLHMRVYALSYSILRISNGAAGLAYSL